MNDRTAKTGALSFRAVTVSEIDSYLDRGGIVGSPLDVVRARYAKAFPSVASDFPCLFSFEDATGAPVSVIWAFPDLLHFADAELLWSWGGALLTVPEYRRMGLAAQLVRRSVEILHSRGYAWGGVFSTGAALRLYRRLGFVNPGYAQRLLLASSFDSVVRGHMSGRPVLGAMACASTRIFARAWVGLCRSRVRSFARVGASREVSWEDTEGVENAMAGCKAETSYGFLRSGEITQLKRKCCKQAGAGEWRLYSLSGNLGTQVGYYILRKNWQETPLRDRYRGFWRVTLMDYGLASDDDGLCSLLVAEVIRQFCVSGAEWLDVVCSDRRLARAFRKALLLRVSSGMSFTFVCPSEWDLPASSREIENWRLNHSSGDGFLF